MFKPRPVPGASRAFESSERKNFWKIFVLVLHADADAIILDPNMDDLIRAFWVPLIGALLGTNNDRFHLRVCIYWHC